jgi:hypothetical protein
MGIFDGVETSEDLPAGDNRPAEDAWTIDMHIRLESLTLANQDAVRGGVSADQIIGRAEIFADYIKNGEIHAEA